ncbi:MAG: translocation/assembly module TamB domain-containing protein, partial [Gemmatimonadota bacterium]
MAAASRGTSNGHRVTAGAAAVFLGSVLGLLLLLRGAGDGEVVLGAFDPDGFRDAVQSELDELTVRPVRRIRVTARQIEWRDGTGEPFLEAPSAVFAVSFGGAVVEVSDGVVTEPRLRLVQTAEDRWNYEQPLAPFLEDREEEASGSDGTAFYLDNVAIERGRVALNLLEASYEVRALDLRVARGQLTGPGLEAPVFQLDTARAELVLPDTVGAGVVRRVALSDSRVRLVEGAVAFEVSRAGFGDSRLADARGVWNPDFGGLGLDVRVRGTEVRVADLPGLPGEVPEDASGRFTLRLEPLPEDRTAVAFSDLTLRAPGSSATGSARLVIGGPGVTVEAVDLTVDPLSLDLVEAFTGPLPYSGRVAGTLRGTDGDFRVDLTGTLATPAIPDPFTAELDGRVLLTGDGFGLRDAAVTLDRVPLQALEPVAPGLPLRGPVSGTIRLGGAGGGGPGGRGPFDLDLRLEAGGGVLTVAGMLDFTDSIPAYDLQGRMTGIRLRDVLSVAAPPVEMHMTVELEGTGLHPSAAEAELVANGTFTGWQTEAGDTLVADLRVADGTVAVRTLRASLGPAEASARGDWTFADGGGGAVRYDLAVAELEPLAPYLPAVQDGQRPYATGGFEARGSVSGTLDAPVMRGQVASDGVRWGEWAGTALEGTYALNTASGGLPRVDVEFSGRDIRTAFGAFDDATLTVDFGRPTFEFALRAEREGGAGVFEVDAGGRVDDAGGREVQVRRLEVDLLEQRWRLAQPTDIRWTRGEEVRVDNLEVVRADGVGRVALQGIVAPVDAADLRLDVQQLPIGDLLTLVGRDPIVRGRLSLDGELSGPADAPVADLQLSLEDGAFRDVPVRSVEGDLAYREGTLRLDVAGQFGGTRQIRVDGSVPVAIGLGDGPLAELRDEAPLDLAVVAEAFPLATLDPGLATLEDLDGSLDADVRVQGTPAQPRLSGSAAIRDGAVTIPLLGRRFSEIEGTLDLTGRQATIGRLTLSSGGTATITGGFDVQDLTDPAFDLTAELDAFRIQDVGDEDAAGAWGTVRLSGSLAQPVLSGDLRVNDGAVSLAPLRQPNHSSRLTGPGALPLMDAGRGLDFADAEGGGFTVASLAVEA